MIVIKKFHLIFLQGILGVSLLSSVLFLSLRKSNVEVINPTNTPIVTTESILSLSPSPLVEKINSSPTTITYDGTRTGPMVAYDELCTGRKIQIYANEQIKFVDYDTKEHLLTSGDIFCLTWEQAKFELRIDKSPCSETNYDCQISSAEKDFLISNASRFMAIVNHYYWWKFNFCDGTEDCKKMAEVDKAKLVEMGQKYIKR